VSQDGGAAERDPSLRSSRTEGSPLDQRQGPPQPPPSADRRRSGERRSAKVGGRGFRGDQPRDKARRARARLARR
jgi:hypothetical protein